MKIFNSFILFSFLFSITSSVKNTSESHFNHISTQLLANHYSEGLNTTITILNTKSLSKVEGEENIVAQMIGCPLDVAKIISEYYLPNHDDLKKLIDSIFLLNYTPRYFIQSVVARISPLSDLRKSAKLINEGNGLILQFERGEINFIDYLPKISIDQEIVEEYNASLNIYLETFRRLKEFEQNEFLSQDQDFINRFKNELTLITKRFLKSLGEVKKAVDAVYPWIKCLMLHCLYKKNSPISEIIKNRRDFSNLEEVYSLIMNHLKLNEIHVYGPLFTLLLEDIATVEKKIKYDLYTKKLLSISRLKEVQ